MLSSSCQDLRDSCRAPLLKIKACHGRTLGWGGLARPITPSCSGPRPDLPARPIKFLFDGPRPDPARQFSFLTGRGPTRPALSAHDMPCFLLLLLLALRLLELRLFDETKPPWPGIIEGDKNRGCYRHRSCRRRHVQYIHIVHDR